MTKIILQGTDCSALFSEGPLYSFKPNPRGIIPEYGSIIYTIWDKQDRWVYVGIGGLGRNPQTPLAERRPVSRILQHRSGLRSGDQFCIYVHDHYVVPTLDLQNYNFQKGHLDRLTRNVIQSELSYRFIVLQSEDGVSRVRAIEAELKRGVAGYGRPLLNGE